MAKLWQIAFENSIIWGQHRPIIGHSILPGAHLSIIQGTQKLAVQQPEKPSTAIGCLSNICLVNKLVYCLICTYTAHYDLVVVDAVCRFQMICLSASCSLSIGAYSRVVPKKFPWLLCVWLIAQFTSFVFVRAVLGCISLAALASATDFSPSSVRDGHQVRGGAKVFVSSEFFLWLARDGEALGLGSVALPFHNTANSFSLGIFHYYRSDTAVSSLSNRTSRKMPMLEIALCDSVRFSFNVFELCKCLCCCGVLLLLMMRVVKATYTQNYWCSHSTDTDSARVYVTDLVDKKINKK